MSTSSSPLTPSSVRPSPAGPLTAPVRAPRSRLLVAVALAWLALAASLALSGAFARAPFLVPVVLIGAIAGPVVAFRRSAALRAWVDALPPRLPILVQVARAGFGAVFLVELGRGAMPAYLAERAGVGDLVVGALAPLVALCWPLTTVWRGRAVLAFNVLGIADLALVVATAQVGIFAWHDPLLLAALPRLPYALLPTVIVPLAILAHLVSLRHRRTARPATGG